jgi:hypothetical protein
MHVLARRILWSVLAALLILVIAGLLFRDAIFSFAVARALPRRGLQCDPVSLHVPLAIPPSPIELGATRCAVGEGPIASIEFKEPLLIELDRFAIASLTCASLEIELRPRAHREVELNTMGDLTRLIGLDRPVLDLMFDSAVISRDANPPLRAARAVVRRAGKVAIAFRDLRIVSGDKGMTVSSPRAMVPAAALLGEGDLVLKATPTAAVAAVSYPGGMHVTIVLDQIDATRPKADFRVAVGAVRPAR